MKPGSISKLLIFTCFTSLSLVGCAHNVIPLLGAEPYTTASKDSMVFSSSELASIDPANASNEFGATAPTRNSMIAAKMYLLDQAYFDYETRLTHDDQFISALGSLATFGTTTVAAAIPAGEATKVLSAVASGVTGGVNLYDQKVLLSQTMQALQNQMRTDRDNLAALIYGRMACSYDTYPQGLAYSDLEAYARAGTLSSALLGLSKTTSQAQTQAAIAKNTASLNSPAKKAGAPAGQALVTQLNNVAAQISKTTACPLVAPPT
jgi:hypothetical protein